MRGWFRLYRDITEHWIYQDAEYLKVWIEMLVRARHSEEASTELIEGQLVTIQQGEFIFGRPGWAKRLGVSEQKLRTLLKKLINDEMIELTSRFNKFSLYRIKNYQNYNQQNNQQGNQHINQQKTASPLGGTSLDNQQNNQQPTSKQPANNQQPTTKEECKERKNEKNDLNKEIDITDSDEPNLNVHFENFWSEYPKKIGRKVAETNWKALRKKKVDPELLITCAKNYAAFCKRYNTENQYILHPSTFLNKDRYMDYAELAFSASAPKSTWKRGMQQREAIPVVEQSTSGIGLSPEELERARELARKLDADRSGR